MELDKTDQAIERSKKIHLLPNDPYKDSKYTMAQYLQVLLFDA